MIVRNRIGLHEGVPLRRWWARLSIRRFIGKTALSRFGKAVAPQTDGKPDGYRGTDQNDEIAGKKRHYKNKGIVYPVGGYQNIDPEQQKENADQQQADILCIEVHLRLSFGIDNCALKHQNQ